MTHPFAHREVLPVELARLFSDSPQEQKQLIKLWCGASTGTPVTLGYALKLVGESYISAPLLKQQELKLKQAEAQKNKTQALVQEKRRQNSQAEGILIPREAVEQFIERKNKSVFGILDAAKSDLPGYGESSRAKKGLRQYADTLMEKVVQVLEGGGVNGVS